MRLSLHQLPCKPLAVEGGTGGGPSGSGSGKHSKPRRARSENWRIELETFARLLCSFTAFSARFFCVETRAWTIERTSILRESNSEVEKRRKPKEEANGSSRSRHAFFSSLLLSPLLNPNLRNSPTPNSPPQQRPLPLRAHPGPRRRAPLPGRARNLRRGAVPAGRTIAALVSKVDTKTSAASPSSSSSGGEENSTSPPRPTGRGPLSRLVEAYIVTTTVGFTYGLNFLREEAEVGKKMNRRRKRKKTHRFFFLFIKKTGLRRCGHHHRRSRSRGARREGEAAGGARRALRERLRLGLREREQ